MAWHTGILLPESFLQSQFFVILAALVALNTTIYAALAIAKILPKIFRRRTYRKSTYRRETRSIYPDSPD
jgi:hypothetical protein